MKNILFFNTIQDKAWKNRALFLMLALVISIGNAWGYQASLTIDKKGPTGAGSVYVANSNSKPGTENPNTEVKSGSVRTSGGNVTMYWWVDINPGYNVSLSGNVTGGPYSAASASGSVSCKASTTPYGTQAYTATATFVEVTVNSVDAASKDLAPTDPSADYPFTVTFATSNLKTIALDLNKSPETADGKFTITSWAQDGNNVIATGKFNGGGSYGGASRNNSTTVSLQSKASGSTAKTCTVTANFPALDFVGVEATEVFATQGDSGKTGSATFTYNYGAEDDFTTTPTLTPVSGSGIFSVTGYTVTPNFSAGTCTVTVDYTYDTNNGVGDTEATLTLTAANGDAHSVTIAGHSEAAATDDAKVIAADGETLIYQGDWATALTKANANAGCTLTLLRNVDLGTITATNNITKAMTIDLNGKELRAAVNATSVGILTITQAVAVTIKDSKIGGKIINEIARNSEIRTIFVNKAGATLTLESGTIAVNNLGQYASAAATVDGVAVAKYASCSARAIHQIAGTTVNIKGGRVEAHGTRSVYGIRQESSAATNKASTTVLNVTGGEIAVEAPYNALGIYAYGKVNMSAGVINTHITTNLIDAAFAADHDNNTNNGYGYGIQMKVSVSATASSCYYGTLNMTGGTINVISDRTKKASLYNYGIYLEAAATGVGAGKTATDGTLSQKASAKASIENANITVHSNTYYSYGIIVYGSYNSYDNEYFTVPIKNCNIDVQAYLYTYAICANAAVNSTYGGCYWGDVELTGNTVTAESVTASTAYAVYVLAATAHIFKDANTTTAPIYYGEYATAAKAVINSGTYTAKTKTTTAYAVCSSTRAKTIYDSETKVEANRKLGGNAEAYPIVIIHGGTFRGEATTTTSRAVSSGGYTTIDGGTFEAFSTSTTAYGLYAVSGKLTASGATISANATQYAYGAYADCGDLPADNTAQTGFAYAAEMELNNCDITATTRTSTEARGVVVNAKNKMHNWKQFQADSTSYKWATTTYNAYKSVFPCTIAGRDSVGIAIAAKATINGCDIKVTAATTTAYGVYSTATSVPASADSVASPIVNIKNTKFTVKTNETTTAYGMYAGGPTTIDGCDFTVQPKTTTAYGVYAYDKKTTITNTKFDVKGTTTAYGLYANAAIGSTTGWDYHGEFELGEGNDMTVAATAGATSHILTLIAAKKNVASGKFMGDYANASSALVTGGSYKATATGKTSYVLNLSAEQVQGDVKAAPSCIIEGGKFWAMADGGTTGICSTNGVIGNILFKGGVYNVNTTLSKHIPEGYEEFSLPNDRPEYSEGYHYAIEPVGNHGIDVCQNTSTNKKYKTLEEALQEVASEQTIVMLANYVMTTPGDYVLPSGATLLIPYKDGTGKGASTAIGNSAQTTTSATTPTLFRKLTLGEGVNLTCFGTIETSAQQKANGQYGANVGMPSGAYGQIHMEEGSHISLEADSRLNCWGYITGKGTINVKKNAAILEGFQMGDWCGGTNYGTLNENGEKVFPVTHYFYQSIECPVTYRPGSRAYGSSHLNVSYVGVVGQDDIALVGTSGSMFIMDDNDVSAETWVMKDYDEATDQCIWTINSGASLGNLTIEIYTYKMRSANYDLPITTNMSVVLNYGEMEVGQNSVFLPGSKLIVNKQGTAVLNGVTVTAYDAADWTVGTRYFATYSPTWGTTNPRKNIAVESAEFFLHGKVDIRNNGGLYTTPSGANIHSTNADAGEVIYTTAAQGDKKNYYLQQGTTTRTAVTTNPARLLNGDGSYTASAGTAKEKTWIYYDDQWQCWTQDEYCFYRDASNNPYAKPNGYVALNKQEADGDDASLIHDAATGTRGFIWDENCYWWEVVTTPTAEGYYKSLNADNNGNYNYYYYDSAADCWKIKKITVTWNVNGTNTNYSVGYGTKPEWFGTTPTKTSSSSDFVWRWDGWTMGSDPTVLANNNLPFVTEDITFTAHFYEKYNEYNITFKNDDGTILESKNWIAGTTPSYEGTPTKNPTAEKSFEFNGTWTPAIATVSGPATYVANYTSHTRKYTITFLNYDMSVLGTAEVPYGSTPTRATYLEAVAPLKDDPYKPDNSAYLFEFAGWRLYGASSNGFVEVAGDQMYIAQYNQTKKYLIQILDIVDADNTNNTNKTLTINATSFALSGWPYIINGTPYEKTARKADRTLVIPYDGNPNDDMLIEVKDKEGTVVSCHMYKVPFVYTSNATLSGTDENSIVFVKSDTLTVGDASAKEIYVAPGAALKVKEDSILDVKKLVLRTTPFEAAILTNKGTIVGQVYYSRIARDTDFHLFAIPAGSNTANVVLSDGTSAAVASTVAPYGNAWQLREYNTARRAKLGADGANWDNIGWDSIVVNGDTRDTTYSDVAIEASKGYELRSGSKYYREYLFPVTLPTTDTSVQVTAATDSAGAAHAGWNIICSPYTDVYKVEYDPRDPTKGIKVSWQKQESDGSYSYIQEQPTQIKPAVPFAYQTKENGSLNFSADSLFLAPRKQSAAEALTETEWIHLDIFDAYGEGDETSLFVHPTRFEQTYKTGIDVAKQSLTAPRPIIYSTHAYGDMAFAGVADSLLENGIDIAVYSPAAQELTFSLRENKFLHRLEYLWLADNETGERTDLLMDEYTCRANAGTAKGRFVLNGRFKAPQISTGIGNTQTDYNIYAIGNNIAISGVEQGTPIYVFDAVGHMIYTTSATSDEVIVPAPCAGVYMLTIGGQTAKLVINQ